MLKGRERVKDSQTDGWKVRAGVERSQNADFPKFCVVVQDHGKLARKVQRYEVRDQLSRGKHGDGVAVTEPSFMTLNKSSCML